MICFGKIENVTIKKAYAGRLLFRYLSVVHVRKSKPPLVEEAFWEWFIEKEL